MELWNTMKAYAKAHDVPILRDAEVPLFCRIVAAARPERILEIGTAIGYSALRMADCLGGSVSITTIELDRERAAAARCFINQSPYAAAISLRQGDASQIIDELDGPWDFIFLDGPKGQYPRQLMKLIPKLLPGAVIVADNMRYHDMIYIQGTVPHKHRTAVERLREFTAIICDSRKFDSVFFENGDGLTVSRWKG